MKWTKSIFSMLNAECACVAWSSHSSPRRLLVLLVVQQWCYFYERACLGCRKSVSLVSLWRKSNNAVEIGVSRRRTTLSADLWLRLRTSLLRPETDRSFCASYHRYRLRAGFKGRGGAGFPPTESLPPSNARLFISRSYQRTASQLSFLWNSRTVMEFHREPRPNQFITDCRDQNYSNCSFLHPRAFTISHL